MGSKPPDISQGQHEATHMRPKGPECGRRGSSEAETSQAERTSRTHLSHRFWDASTRVWVSYPGAPSKPAECMMRVYHTCTVTSVTQSPGASRSESLGQERRSATDVAQNLMLRHTPKCGHFTNFTEFRPWDQEKSTWTPRSSDFSVGPALPRAALAGTKYVVGKDVPTPGFSPSHRSPIPAGPFVSSSCSKASSL